MNEKNGISNENEFSPSVLKKKIQSESLKYLQLMCLYREKISDKHSIQEY
jgi:hypothetical protein